MSKGRINAERTRIAMDRMYVNPSRPGSLSNCHFRVRFMHDLLNAGSLAKLRTDSKVLRPVMLRYSETRVGNC